MPSTCIFSFDRPQPIYYSGEVVNGSIELHTTNEKSVREVYILFEGEAKVRWEEHKSRQRDGKTEHYTDYYRGDESYVNTRTLVYGEGVLAPGTYTYTFSIPLPLQCPSSCVEQYGKISYELSLVLNRPFRYDNVYKQPITVLQQVDLNQRPDLLIPFKNEDIKYFCCWPCSSGPVISTLVVPFGGYAPGQVIKCKLEIDNQSSGYDLTDGIRLRLKQIYRFQAHSPQHSARYHSNTLASTEQNMQCLRLSKRLIESELYIPSVPPTSQGHGILTVRYEIKITIDTGTCHTDCDIGIPITIGTVPLMQSATNPANAIALLPEPTAPTTPGTPDSAPPNYEHYKPPSFEEATTIGGKFIDHDVDEHNRVDGFLPKYPMYNNFAVPTAPAPTQTTTGADQPDAPLLQTQTSATPPVQTQTQTQTQAQTRIQTQTQTQSPPYPVDNTTMPSLPITHSNHGIGWRQ